MKNETIIKNMKKEIEKMLLNYFFLMLKFYHNLDEIEKENEKIDVRR